MGAIFNFLADVFGWLLNFIYNLVNNYGLALILFTIVIKVLLLPISIKQQKAMKKNAKIQEKVKVLQFKYKNDQEKMNQEIINLYKEEKTSPFSGCLSSIIQLILLLSVFYMVRQPLTYMRNIDEYYVNKEETIENVQNLDISQSKENNDDTTSLINYYEKKISEDENKKLGNYQEISVIKYYGQTDKKIDINMSFLGLDLSQIPNENMSDFRVWVIPVLYIISSFVSMRLTTAMQKKKPEKEAVIDITEGNEEDKEKEKKEETPDVSAQTGKTMMWLMPIMTISIAIVAPLGLALYWLANNILMIIERIVFNKVSKSEEE